MAVIKFPSLADNKKRLIKRLALVGGALLVIGVGAAAAWYSQQSTNEPGLTDTTGTTEEGPTEFEKQELADAQQQLKEADTKEERVAAYQQLSNVYVNREGEESQSVVYAQKMVEEQPVAESYGQLAFAYKSVGDYAAAAEAYGKAASLVEKTALDDGRSDYSYFMMEKRLMEEKQ